MPLFKQWVDFVIHPSKPACICSLAERLDTSQAVDPRSEQYEWGMKAIIFERDIFAYDDDDELESVEITEFGGVTVWTRHRVWFVGSEAGRFEKLRFVPRHPRLAG